MWMHLRNASTGLMKQLGYGRDYRYAHDDPESQEMPCLPEALKNRRYYKPSRRGGEARLEKEDDS